MKKRGFTLIELLAVIVILAVIALIAVPLITKLIRNAKENSALRSAELYSSALIEQIQAKMLEDEDFNPTSCTTLSDGRAVCAGETITVVTKDTMPDEGYIVNINSGQIGDDSKLKFNGICLKYNNKKWSITSCSTSSEELEVDGIYTVPPSSCFTTILYDSASANQNFNTNFTDDYVAVISGYTCGDTKLSEDTENHTVTYDNDGLYTNVKLPTTLNTQIITSVTYNETKCIATATESGEEDPAGYCESMAGWYESDPGSFISQINMYPEAAEGYFDLNYSSESIKVVGIANISDEAEIGAKVGIRNLKIPSGYVINNDDALAYNELETLVLSDDMTSIPSGMFMVNNLTEIDLPNSLTTIQELAFAYNNLTEVEFPASIQSIGTSKDIVIGYMQGLPIPQTIYTMGPFIGNNLTHVKFNGVDSLLNLTINSKSGTSISNDTMRKVYTQTDYAIFGWAEGYSSLKSIEWKNPVLLPGEYFNLALKDLVWGTNHGTDTAYVATTLCPNKICTYQVFETEVTDPEINKIEFYQNGALPNGFTKTKLNQLDNILVSNTSANIKAYFDETNKAIYICSDGTIKFNPDSTSMFRGFGALTTVTLNGISTSNVVRSDNAFTDTSVTNMTLGS